MEGGWPGFSMSHGVKEYSHFKITSITKRNRQKDGKVSIITNFFNFKAEELHVDLVRTSEMMSSNFIFQ